MSSSMPMGAAGLRTSWLPIGGCPYLLQAGLRRRLGEPAHIGHGHLVRRTACHQCDHRKEKKDRLKDGLDTHRYTLAHGHNPTNFPPARSRTTMHHACTRNDANRNPQGEPPPRDERPDVLPGRLGPSPEQPQCSRRLAKRQSRRGAHAEAVVAVAGLAPHVAPHRAQGRELADSYDVPSTAGRRVCHGYAAGSSIHQNTLWSRPSLFQFGKQNYEGQ